MAINKTLKILFSLIGVIIALAIWVWNSHSGQDWLLKTATKAALRSSPDMAEFDGLKVFLSGTSSPLPAPGRIWGQLAFPRSLRA